MAATLGTVQLRKYIIATFGVSIVFGLLIIWLWTESWGFGG